MNTDKDIPYGYCHCGCSQKTKIAKRTRTARGQFKGKPMKYLPGHIWRKSPVDHIVDPETGCWEWQQGKNDQGYGMTYGKESKKYGTERAHRIYYIRKYGPIPDGMNVCHHCDNPACVNPDHLFLGTQKDNMLDCSAKERSWNYTYPDNQVGKNNSCAKLIESDVKEIRKLYRQGFSQSHLGRQFGVSQGQIWRIVHRLSWAHID